MVRLLHLLSVDADFQTRRSAGQLSGEKLGQDFRTEARTIGAGGDFRSALSAGRQLRSGDWDIIHAWGGRALITAAMGSSARLIYSPPGDVTSGAIRLLRAAMGYRQIHCAVPTATLRRSLVERGVPAGNVHLVRPGIDFGRIKRRRDDALRAALHLRSDDYVLLAAGASDAHAGHIDAVWATSILHHLDPHFKLLLWGQGRHLDRVARFGGNPQNREILCIAERRLRRPVEFEELLPASDMILVPATGLVPTLPVAIAMAAGLPIVAAVTYTISELLEDHHTALMTAPRSPRAMAQRILELKEDGQLQWRVSDMARTEAYEYFTLTRMLSQYRTLYRQVGADEPVAVSEPAPGPGLRFHGRA